MVLPPETPPRDSRAPGGARRATIGAATAIRGQIAAREDVWIDGQLEGEVRADGHQVTLGATGRMRGQIHARSIVVEGELHGLANGEQAVAVRGGARMKGDIRAPRVALDDGCFFSGTVDMTAAGAAEAAPQPPAAADAAPAAGDLEPAHSGGGKA